MHDKLNALIERLKPSTQLPDTPSNNVYYYATDAAVSESGITYEYLEDMPADIVKGVGTDHRGESVLLFDIDALRAYVESLPKPKISIEEIIGNGRIIGRG